MSTPEAKTKTSIKRLLVKYGAWYFMPVSNGFGKHGIPDFIICHRGKFCAVEAKAPGGKPTALQEVQMALIDGTGGKTFVVDGDVSELEAWLNSKEM